MSIIAFRPEKDLKHQLEHLARHKGINLSALIKMYLKQAVIKDLNEVTENGMTVAEELELLVMRAEGGTGKVYYGVDEYLKSLEELDA